MEPAELTHLLQTELPRVLREHPEVRHEVWGIMLETFPSRQEFTEMLTELRAFREDTNRRFEAVDRRFEAVDRRFEELRQDMDRRFTEVIAEMRHGFEVQGRAIRDVQIAIGALGGRLGKGLEHLVRGVVEEFAGQAFTRVERLELTATEGEVFGVRNARLEFDLFAADGAAYLVEVKSHLEADDVLKFHRKAEFAARRLGRPFTRLMIATSLDPHAERLLDSLGIRSIVPSRPA